MTGVNYMNCTTASAAIASTELNAHLEAQVQQIAPERVDPVAAKIRLIKLGKIRDALLEGEYFTQVKQKCKKLEDFKAWLNEQGFIWKDAKKHMKLYETFSGFPLEQIGWLSLDTLFALLQPKYQGLLEQLQDLPQWVESKIQELMKVFREDMEVKKPKPQQERGWRRVPGGFRAFKLPLLHDEETGMRITQLVKQKYQTIAAVIKEAIAILYAKDILGTTSSAGYQMGTQV